MRRLSLVTVLLLAAAPLFAAEPNPTPRQRELILQLLDTMHFDKTVLAMIDSVYGSVQNQFVERAVELGAQTPAEASELFAIFREEAAKVDFSTVLREPFIQMYAKYFTEEELAALNAFYASSAGQKAIEVMPSLMRDGMQIGAEKLGPKIDEVINASVARYKKKRATDKPPKD